LEKDGWLITNNPLILKMEICSTHIDLGAEKLLAAKPDSEKIAVEIKSLLSPSQMKDLELAIGQFAIYFKRLQQPEPDRIL
jgi:hypothetical protein